MLLRLEGLARGSEGLRKARLQDRRHEVVLDRVEREDMLDAELLDDGHGLALNRAAERLWWSPSSGHRGRGEGAASRCS